MRRLRMHIISADGHIIHRLFPVIIHHLINIYELISVCLSPGNVKVIWETAHFSQKSRLKVKTYIYRSTE